MKELINKLTSGEGKISLLLLEALQYAENIEDKELVDFILNEVNGYMSEKTPEYRKINAEISCEICDTFGNLIYQNYIIDFSPLSESLGLNLAEMYVSESIEFIEENLINLTGQYGERPIPSKFVNLLNTSFQQTNSQLKLVAAFHKFNTASLRLILSKVRKDLIIRLLKANKSINSIISTNTNTQISVFVTYAWEFNQQNENVISFVNFLREHGYNASMDKDASQKESAINFNQFMISNIQKSDKVIIILSPKYKEKANNFTGGVGTEYTIILEDIKKKTNKYIFVSFGEFTLSDITPTGILGREIVNLKSDQDDNNFNTLFSKLQSIDIIPFSSVNEELTPVNKVEIKPFKL